ncbi:FG-GAP-like repeat-containing protein [Candidatus Cloacimonadota bacterium]
MKYILALVLIITGYGCAVNNNSTLVKEAYDLPNTYAHWLKLLESAESDSLAKETIKIQAEYLCSSYSRVEELDVARKGFLLLETEQDSLKAIELKNKILKQFPASKATYDLAYEEFYDQIYPVWNNDSLKVEIIRDLLKKYPETTWRRTMYQYLLYSLDQLDESSEKLNAIAKFREAFPADYLPFLLAARYMKIAEFNADEVTEYALKALKNSYDYPEVEFYPPLEWDLEARSATVKAVAVLADIYNQQGRYEASVEILQKIINDNKLTVDDETTLAGCYFYLAEAYEGLEIFDLAEEFAVNALVEGDSRNQYAPDADTLLTRLLSYHRGYNSNLNYARKLMDYRDVEFSDVTTEVGLENITAGRIAWGDYDKDGWQDILLNGSRLFRNVEGHDFIEVTSTAFPDTIRGNGGLWGDFDNDGDLDIITKDPESVWLNDEGIFLKDKRIQDNSVSTEGMGIGDINRDGYLDLYLANYEKDYTNEPDQFFLGTREGDMLEVSDKLGLIPVDGENRAGRGVNFGDYDNDGDQDIFVSNYRLTDNFLWVNNGSGHFKEQAQELGVSGIEIDGWWGHTIGSEWGDIDNDGDLDLISCNLAHPRYIDFSNKTMLLLNSGFPYYKFTDTRARSGIKFEETHSEPALGDLDNDGYLDLYINDVYEGRRSFLYMNNGAGTFRDVTYLSGTRHFNGWGVAFADYDNDGDLDILAAGGNIQLFRNDTYTKNNWLEVEIIGKDHTDAIGTRLILKNDNVELLREIQGGKGTTNQHSLVQHFGLGLEEAPYALFLRFPTGELQYYSIEEVNKKIIIKE